MSSNNYNIWSTYEMPENKRKAEIWRREKDFWVFMYDDHIKIEERSMKGHSLTYAEDCAENWVHCWGEFTK